MEKAFAVFAVEAPNGVWLKKLLVSFEDAQRYVDYLVSEDPSGYYMIKELEIEEFISTGTPCP